MSKKPIYFDYHATTPLDPRVFEAMKSYFFENFGNAASRDHLYGFEAEKAVEEARQILARFIQADPEEIIFTSGATESNNLALKGVAEMYRDKGDHILTAVTEHRAVLDSAKSLEKKGFHVTYLPVDRTGQVSVQAIEKAITPKTILISIMAANNEIGTLNPIAEIGKLAHEKGIFFHTDAAQAVGKIPLDVKKMNIDLMSFTAHKIYGPKGIGALYVRSQSPRVRLTPLIDGGGHERGFRSGTLNVPAIVGFGKAIEIAVSSMPEEVKKLKSLRDRLYKGITQECDQVILNGHPEKRLPGNLNLSFAYLEGETLLKGLSSHIAVSMGSACTSAKAEPSYVLEAIGLGADLAHAAIRFGLGRFNTEVEVDCAIKVIVQTVHELRNNSPLYEMSRKGVDVLN